jgi:Co/Zn/Cd efflux system component
VNDSTVHLHGPWRHQHHHHGPHRHVALPFRSTVTLDQAHDHDGHHHHDAGHDHVHGRVDPTILRSRAGVRAVSISFAVLGITAALQAIVFSMSGSVALLADLIHNGGDALTAIPLAFAFWVRSNRMERWAGYFVVATIFVSATIAGIEAISRLIQPQHLNHLPALAAAGSSGSPATRSPP